MLLVPRDTRITGDPFWGPNPWCLWGRIGASATETPPDPHSSSVWDAGFAGPWTLGWMKVLGCDAPQDKNPFLTSPQSPLRPEPLQCHSRGTQGTDPHSHTLDMLPTTSHVHSMADPRTMSSRAHRPLHPQWPRNCLIQGWGSLPGHAGTALPGRLHLALLAHCLVSPHWRWVGTALAPTVAPI